MNGPARAPALLAALSLYDAVGAESQREAVVEIVDVDVVVDGEAKNAGGMPGRLV